LNLLFAVSFALFFLSLTLCGTLATLMHRRDVGQHIRTEGPTGHAVKSGTPTMGGTVFIGLWTVAVLILWLIRFREGATGFVLTAGLAFGGIGWLDDLLSLRRKRSEGLASWQKIGLATAMAIGLFFSFRRWIDVPQLIPFSSYAIKLPQIALFVLVWMVFLATPNSVNLTDGLDGLAGGTSLLILVGFLLMLPTLETALWTLPLIAAVCGFLWHNTHPANLFMGDVGSFALGGIIAAVALANGLAFMLPLLGGVIVLESGSVILQVGGYRLTGKRLFKMAPIHHHFERHPVDRAHVLRGPEWPESRITSRFLLIQALFVALTVLAMLPHQ